MERSIRWFRAVWEACSAEGWCDGVDGTEYGRVLLEWMAAGRPEDTIRFIREAANRPVDSKEW